MRIEGERWAEDELAALWNAALANERLVGEAANFRAGILRTLIE